MTITTQKEKIMLRNVIAVLIVLTFVMGIMTMADVAYGKDRKPRIKQLQNQIELTKDRVRKAEEFLVNQKTILSQLEGALSELLRVDTEEEKAKKEAEKAKDGKKVDKKK